MEDKVQGATDEKPPPDVGLIARCILAFGLVLKQARRDIDRVGYTGLVRGSGIRRRYLDLQDI